MQENFVYSGLSLSAELASDANEEFLKGNPSVSILVEEPNESVKSVLGELDTKVQKDVCELSPVDVAVFS